MFNNKVTLKVTYSCVNFGGSLWNIWTPLCWRSSVETYGSEIKIRLLSLYQCRRRWFDIGCFGWLFYRREFITNDIFYIQRAGQHDFDFSCWHLCVCVFFFSVSEAVNFQLKTLVFTFAVVLETAVTLASDLECFNSLVIIWANVLSSDCWTYKTTSW